MAETPDVIADAQAVLDQAYGVFNDLADANVDEEHPSFDKPDERTRRLEDFQHRVDSCRSRLEQQFSGDEPIVELWLGAVENIRWMIDMAYEGRYPSGYAGDSEEFSQAERTAEGYVERWQELAKRTLGRLSRGS